MLRFGSGIQASVTHGPTSLRWSDVSVESASATSTTQLTGRLRLKTTTNYRAVHQKHSTTGLSSTLLHHSTLGTRTSTHTRRVTYKPPPTTPAWLVSRPDQYQELGGLLSPRNLPTSTPMSIKITICRVCGQRTTCGPSTMALQLLDSLLLDHHTPPADAQSPRLQTLGLAVSQTTVCMTDATRHLHPPRPPSFRSRRHNLHGPTRPRRRAREPCCRLRCNHRRWPGHTAACTMKVRPRMAVTMTSIDQARHYLPEEAEATRIHIPTLVYMDRATLTHRLASCHMPNSRSAGRPVGTLVTPSPIRTRRLPSRNQRRSALVRGNCRWTTTARHGQTGPGT